MAGFNGEQGERKQKPLIPEGQHLALCYAIIDLGTQYGTFNGMPTEKPEIQIAWEFPGKKTVFSPEKGEQVMAVFHTYNFSMNEKSNFRKMLDSWVGQPVTKLNHELTKKLLGKPCMIQIVHNKSKDGKLIYDNIAQKGLAVYKRPKEVSYPSKTENTPIFFDLTHFKWEDFDVLPKFLQEKIQKCKEWPEILKDNPRSGKSNASINEEAGPMVSDEEDPF